MINIVVAKSQNNVIGLKGKIPWHISEDMIRFKNLTVGHPVIMGFKTFESLKDKSGEQRILANRTNIVLTQRNVDTVKNKASSIPNLKVAENINEAIDLALQSAGSEEIFVIGGKSIYDIFLPMVDRLYITQIHKFIDGDRFFPETYTNMFELSSSERRTIKIDEFELHYTFETWDKRVL